MLQFSCWSLSAIKYWQQTVSDDVEFLRSQSRAVPCHCTDWTFLSYCGSNYLPDSQMKSVVSWERGERWPQFLPQPGRPEWQCDRDLIAQSSHHNLSQTTRPVIKITLETGIGSDRVTRQCSSLSFTDNPPNHRTTCFIVNITPTSGRSLEI